MDGQAGGPVDGLADARVERTASVLARWPAWRTVLSPVEVGRADALRRPDDFVAAHLLAREVVGDLLAADPAAVQITQTCARCGEAHGRPAVAGRPDVTVSWSHTAGTVAAVASPRPVGIDVEAARTRPVTDPLLRRTATPAEAVAIRASDRPDAAYLRMWVAKEALVKVGAFELDGFARVDVSGGSYWGYLLTVTETAGVTVGLASGPG